MGLIKNKISTMFARAILAIDGSTLLNFGKW